MGVIARNSLEQAIRDELGSLSEAVIEKNLKKALEAYDLMVDHAGCVKEGKEKKPQGTEINHDSRTLSHGLGLRPHGVSGDWQAGG